MIRTKAPVAPPPPLSILTMDDGDVLDCGAEVSIDLESLSPQGDESPDELQVGDGGRGEHFWGDCDRRKLILTKESRTGFHLGSWCV